MSNYSTYDTVRNLHISSRLCCHQITFTILLKHRLKYQKKMTVDQIQRDKRIYEPSTRRQSDKESQADQQRQIL